MYSVFWFYFINAFQVELYLKSQITTRQGKLHFPNIIAEK